MQHAFEKEARLIIAALQSAHDVIASIDNTEMDARKYAILNDLSKHANVLRLELGDNIVSPGDKTPVSHASPRPLKRLFGKDLTTTPVSQSPEPKPVGRTAEEVALDELRKEVDELHARFLVTPTEDIVDRESDIAIRGVAKKAGLPVTEKSPKNINAKFIEQVKQAIEKANEIAALGAVNSNEETQQNGAINQ